MTVVQSMVLVFNAFTGKLDHAYWRSRVGDIESNSDHKMTPIAAYGYLAEHPKTKVIAIKS